MPFYLHQFKYKDEQIRRMLESREVTDREGIIRAATTLFNGKLLGFYFCFGEYDGVAFTEFPDETSALACAMAIFGQGRVQTVHTTPLISTAQGVEAISRAQAQVGKIALKPAGT